MFKFLSPSLPLAHLLLGMKDETIALREEDKVTIRAFLSGGRMQRFSTCQGVGSSLHLGAAATGFLWLCFENSEAKLMLGTHYVKYCLSVYGGHVYVIGTEPYLWSRFPG